MKTAGDQKIIRRQVTKKLESIKEVFLKVQGITSWSSYIREAIGMNVTQLATRIGNSQSSVSELEKREREGNITLNKLKKLANAMDCELAYAFVPRTSITEIVRKQAKKKVLKSIEQSNTHMSLEDQLVKAEINERLEDLIEATIYSKYLWDKNE